jgi:hypothetical protein
MGAVILGLRLRLKNFKRDWLTLILNLATQEIDSYLDVVSERRKDSDDGEGDERGGDGILGQFQSRFISKKTFDHGACSFWEEFLSSRALWSGPTTI